MPAKRNPRITKVCDNCGKTFHPIRNSYAQLARFCSAECYRAWSRTRHWGFKKPPPFKTTLPRD